jgi:colanic acid biosynthesis glycosyl transferase WcaI
MARVLILSLVYAPDVVSTAPVVADIAQGLRALGHKVTVLTSIPHYHFPEEARDDPALAASWRRPYTVRVEEGVRVVRVYMPRKSSRPWKRALEFAQFKLLTLLAAARRCGRQDAILVVSPPISLGLEGYLLARLTRGPMIYDVRELWPDAPVRMGLLKNGILLRLIEGMERFVYHQSAAVTVIARSFADALAERGVPRAKLHYTPNYANTELFDGRPKRNPLSERLGLHDKFVALYAGNIGFTQGLEDLVDVARRLQEQDDVRMVIVGDGAARARLEAYVAGSGLTNVMLLPYQPEEAVPDLYAVTDVCLIPLVHGFARDTVPSKLLTILASGKPCVASVDLDSETAMIIRDADAGCVVPPRSVEGIAEAILRLRADPALRRAQGENGRQYLRQHFSREATLSTYDRVIRQVANGAADQESDWQLPRRVASPTSAGELR